MMGVPLDCGIIGDDHTETTMDEPDSCDDTSRVDLFFAVEFVAGEGRELEEG